MIAALALLLAAAAPAPKPVNVLSVERRADLTRPVVLQPGQGALVIGWRREAPASLGKSGMVAFARYNPDRRDMIARPDGARKNGDPDTYWIQSNGGNKKLPLDYTVMIVSAGDYVLYGASPGPVPNVTNSFCFSAPMVRVNAGETVYFGDISPWFGKLETGEFVAAMPWSSHPDDARAAVAGQPALAAGFKVGDVRNGASFTCSGQDMTAYIIPGLPSLPELTPEQKAALAADAPATAPPVVRPAPTMVTTIPSN